MKMKVSELEGAALDWAVAKCEGYTNLRPNPHAFNRALIMTPPRKEHSPDYLCNLNYSSEWALGGPIIESANITVIRANDDYEKDAQGFTTLKRVPVWFAERDQCVGHSLYTSYEGENMEPTFLIGEGGGYYGPSPLIAAMRCYVSAELGDEVEIPEELCPHT